MNERAVNRDMVRQITALVTLLCATLLGLVELPLFQTLALYPVFPILVIAYYQRFHRRLLPLWGIFLAGLITDAALSPMLGQTALLWILFALAYRRLLQRLEVQSLSLEWLCFSAVSGVMAITHYLINTVEQGIATGFYPLMANWLLTVLLYPLTLRLFQPLLASDHRRRIM